MKRNKQHTTERANMSKKGAESKKNDHKNEYSPIDIELKWQAKWEEGKIYQPKIYSAKHPFYNLMMFPYPSAEGLHVGSFFTYGGIDAYGRFKRMQGYEVFQPMGLDGFGIHSENYAMKVGRTPKEHASISEKNFYRQLRMLGNGYDWSRKLETYDPEYYKWTQWLFIELFKAGLAYKDSAPVNFCPSCKTVLSDEQVIDGKCERCGNEVEKRELSQWFFRITGYAERLLTNTEKLDWSEKVKVAQKNWIGKKSGINITYKIVDKDGKNVIARNEVTVFTTRPDTNFGATFIALAPENPLALEIATTQQKAKVKAYIKEVQNKSEIERQSEGKDKSGVFTGAYAMNELTGYKMPIWVSDFVLGGFGTGALVGVPGHDTRDFEFAQKFGLEIKRVVKGRDGDTSPVTAIEQVQEEEGTMINSGFLDGMDIHEAIEKIMDYMEEKGHGERVISYHLRDWLISRQRYWGPPIPMIYCENCAEEGKSWFNSEEAQSRKGILNSQFSILNSTVSGWYPVPEKDLPVLLPDIEDFRPVGTGKAPLDNHPEFYKTTCPGCGGEAKRETDVSDTFLDSSWYYFRYTSTDIENRAFDIDRVKKWLPVTSYIGGAEHAVLHLLYSRFITMVLKDLGYIDFEEPFARFRANGLIIKDGAKMSKSKGNVINPDEYVKKFGADTLRTYLGFVGPFTQGGDFQDSGIEGINRFLKRIWTLVIYEIGRSNISKGVNQRASESFMHKTIKGVTEDMEELRFNTAIAKLMTYYNYLSDQESVSIEEITVLLKLLAPFAPHMTEELWSKLINKKEQFSTFNSQLSIHLQPWPSYDEEKIVSDTVTIAVQVNGKLRGTIELKIENGEWRIDKRKVEESAIQEENVVKYLEGKKVRKVIYIPGKIINFVI
jgi:leucyl-tRNA synthetase